MVSGFKLGIAAPMLGICSMIGAGTSDAQVTLDGSANPSISGPVLPSGGNYDIRAELGRQAGRNLFHSFGEFSLRTGERATFSGPNQIRNIISRVTGGQPSDIDGTIASTIPGADFYFINPAGVLFGPNASLDVQGSFHVSTADDLRFADGKTFSASNPSSTFTVARPEAFGFLGSGSGGIAVRGSQLEVEPGRTLSLVGGDVAISGRGGEPVLHAESGTITLAGIGAEGQFRLATGVLQAPARSDITITDQALIDASGNGGGKVVIRGGNLLVDHAAVAVDNLGDRAGAGGLDLNVGIARIRGGKLTANADQGGSAGSVKIVANLLAIDDRGSIDINTFGSGRGGDVVLKLGRLEMRGSSRISAGTGGPGRAGDIVLNAERIELHDGSRVAAVTLGSGAAGDITVNAGEFIATGADPLAIGGDGVTRKVPSGLSVASLGLGPDAADAGSVFLQADSLKLLAGAQIGANTFGPGAAGDLSINVREMVVSGSDAATKFLSGVFASTQGAGDAGTIAVSADQLLLRRGGTISSATSGGGNAGTVAITADQIQISGGASIKSQAEGSTGNGGSVTVKVGNLLEIREESTISSTTFGAGDAGTVTVGAGRLVIDGSGGSGGFLTGIASQSEASGAAGSVFVEADRIELRDGGGVQALSTAEHGGTAGSITVKATDELVMDEGVIRIDSAAAGGGSIRVQVGNVIDLHDGAITTSVQAGEGPTAGNVLIDPKILVIDGGVIQANAPEGSGGDITIVADNTLVPGNDLQALIGRGKAISASGEVDDGRITINTPELDLSGGLVLLEGSFIDVAGLRARCSTRHDIGASSFTGVGRGGLPPGPDAPLSSAHLRTAGGATVAAGCEPAGDAAAAARGAGLAAACVPLD